MDHCRDVWGTPLGLAALSLEKPADLGRGPGGDGAEPRRGPAALALGLPHAPVADEDHRGDPTTGPAGVYCLRIKLSF